VDEGEELELVQDATQLEVAVSDENEPLEVVPDEKLHEVVVLDEKQLGEERDVRGWLECEEKQEYEEKQENKTME